MIGKRYEENIIRRSSNETFGDYLVNEFPKMVERYSYSPEWSTHHLRFEGIRFGFISTSKTEGYDIVNTIFVFEQFRRKGFFKHVVETLLSGNRHFYLRPVPFEVRWGPIFGDHKLPISCLADWEGGDSNAFECDDEERIAALTATYEKLGLRRCEISASRKLYLTSRTEEIPGVVLL